MESVERHKRLIQHLTIRSSAYVRLSSSSERGNVVSSVMANSVLTTLNLYKNLIGDSGAKALSEALKTNTTLTTLEVCYNMIGPNGAVAL
ncbi:hypothetical protein BGZ88_007078, partial [Linnemannia elongata]